ncbi:MAG TPA: 50S ribosomal protein L29 [Clostridiales bacterium]|nr:MAG: 50S ribosomal protein L29 [Clostridiales bacterium GWD2_32_19]HCC07387.1 50S ribosomal protein L29 [Clostridiales bacterium]
MKTTKIREELRLKNNSDLNVELVSLKKELFNLRFQNATNQLQNTARIKEVKKGIARVQTIITEKNFSDNVIE